MGKVTKIVNASKRTGEKNGKTWNIMSVEVEDGGAKIVADSFDKLEVGSEVFLTKNEYGYSAKIARGGGNNGAIQEQLNRIEKKIDQLLGTDDGLNTDIIADDIPSDW